MSPCRGPPNPSSGYEWMHLFIICAREYALTTCRSPPHYDKQRVLLIAAVLSGECSSHPLHATRRTPHGAWRLAHTTSACVRWNPRRALYPGIVGMRGSLALRTTTMQNTKMTPPLAPPPSLPPTHQSPSPPVCTRGVGFLPSSLSPARPL